MKKLLLIFVIRREQQNAKSLLEILSELQVSFESISMRQETSKKIQIQTASS